jgi:O-antigen/teichoic acid export membrane protein
MMENKSGLFQATAWYGIGNFFVRLVGFLLLPLYSNLIPVEHFGIYSLMMSTYAIAGVFYQFGMNAALTNFYLKENDESKRKIIFSTVINSIALLGSILTIIAFLISSYLARKVLGSNEFTNLFILLFIILLLETVSSFILQLFKTQELSKKAVAYLLIGAVINLLLNIWFVYVWKMGISGIIYAHLITAILVFISLLPSIKNSYQLRLDTKVLNPILIFSLPLFISGLFAIGMDVADRFILDHFFGKKEVGEYSFAYRLAMITNIFVISFRTAWTPYSLNRYQKNDSAENFGRILVKILVIGAFILFAVSFFADDLFNIKLLGKNLFGAAYKNGIVILPYVVIGYIFSSLASFYSVYPFVSNKSYHFLISDGLGLITNLILNFILIPSVGLVGAGIATCVSFIISAGYLYIISKNQVNIDYRKREMMILVFTAIPILILGIEYNNFILQIGLALIYLLVIEFVLKIKLSRLFRILN